MKPFSAVALLVASLTGCAGPGWTAQPMQAAAPPQTLNDYRYMATYPPLALNDGRYSPPTLNEMRYTAPALAPTQNDNRYTAPAPTQNDSRYTATSPPSNNYGPTPAARRGLLERLFGPGLERRNSACYFPASPTTPVASQPQPVTRHVVRNGYLPPPIPSCPVNQESQASMGPVLPAVASEASSSAMPSEIIPASFVEAGDAHPPGPPHRLVNSKRISLNYEVKDVGPSGVSLVELWYTQDGRKWSKGDAPMPAQAPCIVEVKEEGMHGFTLVARNGIGLGKKPPMVGDTPQVWVEVDSTKPSLKIVDLRLNLTPGERQLNISWQAADKNLAPRPISISFARRPEGPWTPIAANVENTGSYVWLMQPGMPNRFYVRVEAVDLVGNVGMAQTPEPFLIDMAQPTVRILAIESAAK